MILEVAHLYPDLLNLYGDSGNVRCIQKRCEWRNIECRVHPLVSGTDFKFENYDLIFIGGGQDSEQSVVLGDLTDRKINSLQNAVNASKTILAICGGYQLLGKYYETHDGKRMNFTGIIDFYTVGREKRLIGNYEFKTKDKIRIIGFENHSGRTCLGDGVSPLGRVIKGFGNNGKDRTEGVRFKNTFCSYCHGPMLPKNPDFADLLIKSALETKYGKAELEPLDCTLEVLARKQVRDLYI